VASDLIIDNLKFYSLGDTFRVLKEKGEKQYGEYRTRCLVLEAWDNMELMHKSNGAPWDCWEG
jgi:hypothetical protein